jgi:sulfofructose kinase
LSLDFDVLGIGLNATDTLLVVPEFPPYAGKIALREERLSPGGQVATAIVACAKLGLRAKYIGTIGDDYRGTVQRDSLTGTGVDASDVIVREGCPNQTGYIIIDESTGERTVLWHRSDQLKLLPSEIKEESIASCRLLHMDGYDIEAASHAGSIARRHNVPVCLDVDTLYPDFEAVLQYVDYLVAGSGWPAKWTGYDDPFQALACIQSEYGMRVASMTLGDFGCLALENGNWFYSPAYEVTCMDTTGAGDVYHGAFCYGVITGMTLQDTLEFSNAAAAINCTAVGARGHIPVRAEVDALMALGASGKVKRRENREIASRCHSKAQPASVANP